MEELTKEMYDIYVKKFYTPTPMKDPFGNRLVWCDRLTLYHLGPSIDAKKLSDDEMQKFMNLVEKKIVDTKLFETFKIDRNNFHRHIINLAREAVRELNFPIYEKWGENPPPFWS